MPLVTIQATSGTGSNPTAGTIKVTLNQTSIPVLSDLQTWSPGNWFADTAAWRPALGSPLGIGGTPAANAGSGDLFNNQYGFMFMGSGTMMMAYVPAGKALGIELVSISSADLQSFNYVNSQNRWDEVWDTGIDSQLLWNGSMWHNYYTLPSSAAPGEYTATYRIFMANQAFTAGTGFVDYSAAAKAATADPNFTPANVTYKWTVVPEPRTGALAVLGVVAATAAARLRKRRSNP